MVAAVLTLAVSAAGTACSAGESGEDGRGRDEPDERGESGEQGGGEARPSAYGAGWGAVHADAANTDYAPVEGAADVALRWQRSLGGNVNLGPTVDDSGQVHVTTAAPGCHLYVLDAATGETVWCSEEVDRFAAASSPLLDADGRIFLADGEAMHAFDADGNVLWTTPIVGVPLSAQLTPEGRVIFVTHVGVVYVLRRDTGEPLLPPLELIPGATFDPAENMRGCPLGTADCPSANTIAVDLDSGRFFFTFWAPGAPQAGVRAMRYTEDPEPALTPVWTNDEIPGGSASSPDISADGRRIYLNDNAGSMHALDAVTGDGIWSFPLGYVTGGSPSTSPEGRIMPAGGLGDSPLLALTDEGDAAATAWRNDDETNKGIATQTAGDKAYATVAAGPGRTDLVVLDASTGEELDREPLPGTPLFSVGITVGPDGTVYVPSITGELYAFAAADEEPTLAEN